MSRLQHVSIALALLALFCSGCGYVSKDKASGQSDRLLGRWYFQQAYGDAPDMQGDFSPYLDFQRSGRVVSRDPFGILKPARYRLDEKDRTILVTYEPKSGPQQILLRYRFVEGVLLLHHEQLSGHKSEEEGDTFVMELTRSESGTPRHEAIRELQQGEPLNSEIQRSNDNLRVLINLIMAEYEAENGHMPSSLGELAISGEVEIDRLFVPWIRQREPLPKTFSTLSREKKVGWLSTYSSYTYLYGDRFGYELQMEGDRPQLILFELSSLGETRPETVGMAFSDRSVRRVPASEASKILKEETGWTLREWETLQ